MGVAECSNHLCMQCIMVLTATNGATMARPRKPLPSRTVKPSKVIVRNILDDLPPKVRAQAIKVAGGDATRVRVIGPGSYEVVAPAFIPEAD